MKIRLLPVALLAVALPALSSCTREYVCQCTIVYTGQPGLPDTVHREYPLRDTKSKARDLCQGNSYESTTGGITTKESCDLY